MKIRLIISVIILVLICGIILFFITGSKKQSINSQTTSAIGFPVSTSTSNSASSSNIPTIQNQSIPLRDGSTANTKDFIHNGTTIEDPANQGTYYLAGSSGACNKDGSCPTAGTNKDYNILYYPAQNSFNIGIATEPLGPVRLEAEQYLMNALGISEQQMCELNYYVGTTVYVNPQYAGKNLGFSFCPGATALPQ
jgi:hypothetical protein